jgi:transposase-like protein
MKPLLILDQLKEDDDIDDGEYNRLRKIVESKSEEDCNRELLTTVLNKRGPDSLKKFIKILEDTRQKHIVAVLTKSESLSD